MHGSSLIGKLRRSHPASCPFDLNTAPAAGVVRNLISAFAADESFEPTPTPAWKTVYFCSSGGKGQDFDAGGGHQFVDEDDAELDFS